MAIEYGANLNAQNENTESLTTVSNNINSLVINTSDLPAAETKRSFVVNGDIGAKFQIIALQNPSSSSAHTLYYDWNDGAFASGHNDLHNNLSITLKSKTYNNDILFPSGAGEFVIKLIPIGETTIKKLTGKVITKSISKPASNATVTFTPGTLSTNAANYATLPTSTSAGAINSNNKFSFSWDVTNSTTDAKSFGFRLLRPAMVVNDGFWYFQETDTVNGTVSSSTTVVIDDITDIVVGMTINEVSSGSLSGTPRITAIDTVTKTITLNLAQSFADGITLYFRAYGIKNIQKAIDLDMKVKNTEFVGQTLTSTLRDDSDGDYTTSTTVRLGATNGISGGGVVKYQGEGVNNSSANTVTSVTPDPDGTDGDGAMVVSLTQKLLKGAVITFNGSHKIVNFSGEISINRYPAANRTIYLDLEKIITLGTAS